MPITRRDEKTDPFDPYILLLWGKKWLIAGIAILTAVLVYVVLLFVPSIYKVSSEIFVNRLPALTEGEPANPESAEALLQSQAVIAKVRDDYTQAFELENPPDIEDFAKQFEVESLILQDTTVRKEVSPVLSLQVEAEGSSETRFIMDRWIRHFVSEFGNFTAMEAVIKREAFEREKSKLEAKIAEVEQQQADLEAHLPLLRKLLAEKLDLLSPSRLRSIDDEDTANNNNINLDLTMRHTRMQPGLLERYAELELQVRAGNASTTAATELSAISASIDDARTSITSAQQELAEATFEHKKITRHLQMLRQNQSAVNDALSRFVVSAAVYKEVDESGLPAGGDIRALSMPVTPDLRVWPKRTISAGIAGIVAAILTIFAILARNFLTKISPVEPQ